MMLGDLGADVIMIEPPGGTAARREGPFLDDVEGVNQSLRFYAYNRNKRSLVLDLENSNDRNILKVLVAGADFVLESSPGGLLARHGIDFDELRQLNPTIVHVLISPFGADGPAADRIANDLTLAAMGGQASLQGSPERPPVRVSIPQAWRHASAQAATAAVIAHARMRVTGQAQFVDVSAQCSVTWTMMNAMNAYAIQGFEFDRMGSTVQMGTRAVDPVFECADGYLVALPIGAVLNALLGHIAGDDLLDADWLAEDWETFDIRMAAEEETTFTREQVRDLFVRYFRLHTKEELFALGFAAGVTLAPINNVADLTRFEQLDVRGAWHEAVLPNGQQVRTPGLFAKMNQAPMAVRYAPPRLDEHGDQLRTEASYGVRERQPLPAPVPGADYPFEGVKVLDLTWVIAGPASVRYLSDHGATVIKVESELRPDGLRLLGPVKGEPGWNRSHFYGEFNAGKLCVQLQLKEPGALEILHQLIQWADVLVENWAPGATTRLGIDYESCVSLNPDLIMVSTSLLGQYGPMASIAGYGYHAAGMAGFYEVTGWPDMSPHGPWLAYTDVIAPHFIVASIGAALDHRRRTGKGQHIDAAQFEMALQFLAPEILDAQANGYVATRMGNRKRDAAPQGIYPCSDKSADKDTDQDQWCAIAVDTDEQWQALKAVLHNPAWAQHSELDKVAGRIIHHDTIDTHLSEWTKAMTPTEVMDILTTHGVPAGAVQRSKQLSEDPQYIHRKFQHSLDHPNMGKVPYAGNQFRIPGYAGGPRGPAPLLGEHNQLVFGQILGMSEADVTALLKAGVVL
jgi:crotonobetainyl-CoA:carnitine CoA-transferase CaiB-like acyl-CoA transferase